MKIIDISWPLSAETTEYKDRGALSLETISTVTNGGAGLTRVCLDTHTGTHFDAPSHFIDGGGGIESYALEQLCGPARVIDFTRIEEAITADDLKSADIQNDLIVLFKTKNSDQSATGRFFAEFIYLEKSGAEYLREQGVKAVGIDYLGIERGQPDHETHTTLLGANIPIIEGLRLAHVEAGDYTLICLPLALQGVDGAPARAVLWG